MGRIGIYCLKNVTRSNKLHSGSSSLMNLFDNILARSDFLLLRALLIFFLIILGASLS